jgi:erythromycin esterase
MLKFHQVLYVMFLLASLPAPALAQDAPAACAGRPVESLDLVYPWRGIIELSGAEQRTPPVRCLKIVLTRGEFVRAVVALETEPPSSGARLSLHQPGETLPTLQLALGNTERVPVTWRAEASGSHYIVISDAWTFARGVTALPIRMWIEQVEPPAVAGAWMAALSADPRVAWLRQNVTRVRSIDPRDTDFSDLEPLRDALQDVRIVLLGEADHASGSDFSAKSRLVMFLHRELGFDVLAFEAGLYDMGVAWDRLRAGVAPRQAFAEGAWGFWANSEQMQPLIEYVAGHAHGNRPLEIAGFDNQFSGQSSERFAADLADFLGKRGLAGPLGLPAAPNMHILESLSPNRVWRLRELPDSTRSAFLRGLDRTLTMVAALNDSTARYWTQVLRSTACHTRFLAPAAGESASPGCSREQQMTENLIWLASQRYPGRKIIIWSATAHAARMPQLPAAAGEAGPSLGLRLYEQFGSKTYAIGVTSYRSAQGQIVSDQHPLPEFEELMAAAGFDYGFVDLRRARSGRSWIAGEFLARPIFQNTMLAVWSELLDALLFVREHQLRSRAR